MAESDPREDGSQFSTTETLAKLLNQQIQDEEATRLKQKTLTKYKEDYEALLTRLSTLPDKVSHEVFVPMGSKAFFPGRLKHTNEILVLLGDNWFVERSAKQACDIVQRRIKHCTETLNGFEKELKLRSGWRDQTKKLHEELNQGVNIVEQEEDDSWREKHRERVKESRRLAKLKEEEDAEARHPRNEEEDLWRRLDELELQEELQHELDLQGLGDGDAEEDADEETEEGEEDQEKEADGEDRVEEKSSQPADSKSRRVTWSAEDSVRPFLKNEILQTVQVDDDEAVKITFKHTEPRKGKKETLKWVPSAEETPSTSVSSPSDIYNRFVQLEHPKPAQDTPKSILKVKKCTTPNNHIPPMLETAEPESSSEPKEEHGQVRHATTAVSEEVKEREGPEGSDQQVGGVDALEPDPSINTHRPVSRFRAARMRSLPKL